MRITPTASMLSDSVFQLDLDLHNEQFRSVWMVLTGRIATLLLVSIVFMLGVIHAQTTSATETTEPPYVVDGVSENMAYAIGRSLRINGTVKNGAIALGGDVIVQGTVEGDVAAIGGSIIQLEGARIGGDVIVVGGAYRPLDKTPNRNPAAMTIMYAGYEAQLRNIMRNPRELLAPTWSASYLGFRLLAILFWFIISLALTAAMPGTISRGIARLQLSSLRVAIIGIVGALVISVGVPFCLHYLPSPISVLVGLMALLLILVAGLFGRVIIYAATGRWLQRKFLKVGKNSESVALLLGTTFWIALSSLPYIWPLVVAGVLVTSLGLALTARYKVGWRRRQEV
ncbi:MAG TPA: polymer-forming cytoskeletal protein [Pyrinomonadaceae bacterium]|nr:polymer-forming cytoskeletal protein [Pyrinomonadaceae bacterium]